MVLGPTHEEVITELVSRNVHSYRDLPLNLYQIQTKLRDEARPRAGLIRVREFAMKDAYSFHADEEDLDRGYRRMIQAYHNIFSRCGLDVVAVEADSGAIGGKDSQEFIHFTESGEDEIILCGSCGYAANMEKAEARIPEMPKEDPLPLERVDTPGVSTIPDLSRFLHIPEMKTLKAVFYTSDGEVVFVTIRGDLEVNEVKLRNALHCAELRLATDEEVRAAGLVPGYASAVGLQGVRRVADHSITSGANFVVGANEPNAHLRNANYPRDFEVDEILDIAKAQPGHGCPHCGNGLELRRGIEVGHVFKIGTTYSKLFSANFLDRDGTERPVIMGTYGIGVGRLLGAVIESSHDEKGIIFPTAIAPFPVHLVALNIEREEVQMAADRVYADLQAAGLEVLYEDREESAGVKFSDADLLGMPVRVTVSPRTMADSEKVELKRRRDAREKAMVIPLNDAVQGVKQLLATSD